jgi:hypothetical protein
VTLYDQIGAGYDATRRADRGIARRLLTSEHRYGDYLFLAASREPMCRRPAW